VTPLLSLRVDSYQFIIGVEYFGICWDIVCEFDCRARKGTRGFYCELCLPEYRKYYQGLADLYEKHTFLTFIDWCKEKFSISQRIFFYGRVGCSSAYIRSVKEEFELQKNEDPLWVAVEPILTEAFLPKKPNKFKRL